MNEQWTLSIEDKVLLAEKVMGWRQINHKWYRVDVGFSLGFFSVDGKRFIHYPPHGSGWVGWQPETDEGDAARLFIMLPRVNIIQGLDNENQSWFATPYSDVRLPKTEFCQGICLVALDYAKSSLEIL